MRCLVRNFLRVLALLSFASAAALAQQRIGQSGYDPFQLNAHTGRFVYVPIPYDPEPPGANYNPFRFNWHSGEWDYVAQPMLSDYDLLSRGTDASSFVDTRLDLQILAPRTMATALPAPPIPLTLPPPPINPHVQPPVRSTTKPATNPAKPASSRERELARLRSIGRWNFNYNTGRWMFILPSDQ